MSAECITTSSAPESATSRRASPVPHSLLGVMTSDQDAPTEPTPRQRMWQASRRARLVLSGARPSTLAERLRQLAASQNAGGDPLDVYGDGIVATLENRVAQLLGKPAAAWFPTGTMAQQAILRVWTGRTGSRRVGVHPLHHTQVNEDDAFTTLSGFEPVFLTSQPRHPTAEDLRAAPGPLGAVVLELPMQELGYVLPDWSDYVALAETARELDVPLHVDGARLWESQHHYSRSLPEIAALASSVYVSMYKGVGGLSGAVVAGERDVIDEARVWRTRYGGNAFQQFPAIVAALDGLDTRLEQMAAWHQRAIVVAQGLSSLPGMRPTPSPPHINEFWVYADLPEEALNRAVLEHLEATGERWLHGWWTDQDGRTVGEATVGDAALEWTADDVVRVGRMVIERAQRILDA